MGSKPDDMRMDEFTKIEKIGEGNTCIAAVQL